MKRTMVAAVLALGFSAAHAHGCEGAGACTSGNGNSADAQRQQQTATGTATGTATASGAPVTVTSYGDMARAWSVTPVQAYAPPVISPSATVNRMVSGDCGPRMKLIRRTVNGLNNRTLTAQEFDAGTDEYVIPDTERAYDKIQLTPTKYQLIGHRVVETSAVTTVSTSHGWGVGGNGNNGGGGSIGMSSGGGIQRLITTIRLHECVVATVDETPVPPPPKVIYKTRVKVVEKPVLCVTCVGATK